MKSRPMSMTTMLPHCGSRTISTLRNERYPNIKRYELGTGDLASIRVTNRRGKLRHSVTPATSGHVGAGQASYHRSQLVSYDDLQAGDLWPEANLPTTADTISRLAAPRAKRHTSSTTPDPAAHAGRLRSRSPTSARNLPDFSPVEISCAPRGCRRCLRWILALNADEMMGLGRRADRRAR